MECILLKKDNHIWLELKKKSFIEFTSSGFIIRDSETKVMIGDFPSNSLVKVAILDNNINRLYCNNENVIVALKFNRQEDNQVFRDWIYEKNIKISLQKDEMNDIRDNFTMPDLSDVHVQEFIAKLLFSSEFKDFVKQLKSLLNAMETNIEPQDNENKKL